jgi:predicted phosphodiesterase
MHLPFFMSPDADIIISGHTHEFEIDLYEGRLFLNPGECCARNKPLSEYALLEVEKDYFQITQFFKNIKTSTTDSKVYTFNRI